jgi:hypothetical protein
VELRDDRGKPAGSIEVQLAWLPRRKARKQVGGGRPSQLTVGVIRGEDIRSPWGSRYEPYKGHYDPYCVVRVGTTSLRTHTVANGARGRGIPGNGSGVWQQPAGLARLGIICVGLILARATEVIK